MDFPTTARPEQTSTLYGLAAILFWSTTIAFSRSLTEQLGTFTAAALIYVLAGVFGLLYAQTRPGKLGSLFALPRGYLLICGGLFVIYITCLYLAVGFATSRTQVIAVGLLNYLWPALSLVLSIPILGRRARPLLPAGILLALAGTWLATTASSDLSMAEMLRDQGSLLPYSLAGLAAVAWAAYSNLSRKLAADSEGGAVPLFLLVSGLVLSVVRLFIQETSQWSLTTGLELAYMALFPGMIAYVLWDLAVRKGEIILVASLSYLTPLLSTLTSALVLKVHIELTLWLAAGLVITGALICRATVTDP